MDLRSLQVNLCHIYPQMDDDEAVADTELRECIVPKIFMAYR